MSHPVLAHLRARVRDAVARGTLPEQRPAHPGRFAWESHAHATPDERVERFTRELQPLGGTVTRLATVDAARDAVVSMVVHDGTREVLAWADAAIGVPGLTAALHGAGITIVPQPVDEAGPREERVEALGRCGVGITGADFALADTGSLVLASGPGRGRLASLLPPVHIAVVRIETLVWTLADVLTAAPGLATSGSNLAVITGPSRTADIEMTLTRGVHGPRDVHVVIVG